MYKTNLDKSLASIVSWEAHRTGVVIQQQIVNIEEFDVKTKKD